MVSKLRKRLVLAFGLVLVLDAALSIYASEMNPGWLTGNLALAGRVLRMGMGAALVCFGVTC